MVGRGVKLSVMSCHGRSSKSTVRTSKVQLPALASATCRDNLSHPFSLFVCWVRCDLDALVDMKYHLAGMTNQDSGVRFPFPPTWNI